MIKKKKKKRKGKNETKAKLNQSLYEELVFKKRSQR